MHEWYKNHLAFGLNNNRDDEIADDGSDNEALEQRERKNSALNSLSRALALIAKHKASEEENEEIDENEDNVEDEDDVPFYRQNILSVYDQGQLSNLLKKDENQPQRNDEVVMKRISKISAGYLKSDRDMRESQLDKVLINQMFSPDFYPIEENGIEDAENKDVYSRKRNYSSIKIHEASLRDSIYSEDQRTFPVNSIRLDGLSVTAPGIAEGEYDSYISTVSKSLYGVPDFIDDNQLTPMTDQNVFSIETGENQYPREFNLSEPRMINVKLVARSNLLGPTFAQLLDKTLFHINLCRKNLQFINKLGNVFMIPKLLKRDEQNNLELKKVFSPQSTISMPLEGVGLPTKSIHTERVTMTVVAHKDHISSITKSIEIQKPPFKARQNISKEQPKGVLTTTRVTTYVDIIMDKDGNTKITAETPQVVIKNPDARMEPLIIQVTADAVLEFPNLNVVSENKLGRQVKFAKSIDKTLIDNVINNAITSLKMYKCAHEGV